MHPDRRFRWSDAGAMRAFVATRAFAQLCVVADGAPLLAHAPLSVGADGVPRFHIARANPITRHLDSAMIAASIVGDDFYVSPDWYAIPDDQVPTWNYRAVEIYGRARRLDETELRDQLDTLSATQEERLAPKPAWTSAKVSPPVMARLLGGIAGFAIEEARFVDTEKMSQNKSEADRTRVFAAARLTPLPLGREGPARASAWEGEGSHASSPHPPIAARWVPHPPSGGEGL